MAHVGIVNLAERLLNQSQTQTEESSSAPTQNHQTGSPSPTLATAPAASTLTNADQFTASTQSNASDATAQAAGLFSVKTLSLFTAAANFILGAAAGPNAGNSSSTGQQAAAQAKTAPGTVIANPAANSTPPSTGTPTANSAANAAAPSTGTVTTKPSATTTTAPTAETIAADAAPPATAEAAVTPVPASTFIPPPTLTQVADTNAQLQSLNGSLAALGLSQSDITVIDRVATALQDYNPTTYTDLVYQLEGLAQTQPPQTNATQVTATAAQNPSTAGNPATPIVPTATPNPSTAVPVNISVPVGAVPNGSSATGNGGLQLQGLVIRFAGGNGTQATSQSSATSAINQQNALNPQVQEVTLTLNSGNSPSAALVKAAGA
jgi:hypothetical protein